MSQPPAANLSTDAALAALRQRYAAENPNSEASYRSAQAHLPGGNTRSVLFFEPFPLTMQRGEGADAWDVDGHAYADFVGEFSAGLYGHSDPTIRAAIIEALDRGLVLAAPTDLEQRLAAVIAARFPAMQRLRFCNSGTEANLFAIVTARAVTKRSKVLAFRDAYHGGVLVFSGGGSPTNVPFEIVLGDYNDAGQARDLIRRHGDTLAAVIVEPILGAGGNIPGTPEFIRTLREETAACGALLIFDEVKTSRCGPGGMQGELGIAPDLTTLGKYIAGGLPSGAFGGRADIMDHYDPKRSGGFRHAGTFNNNVCSMNAGLAGLTKVFTQERARRFHDESEAFRQSLNAELRAKSVPMTFAGLGSLFTVHFTDRPVTAPKDIPAKSRRLAQVFHMECLSRGVLTAYRGDVFLSLAAVERHRQALREAALAFADSYGALIERELAAG